MAVSLTITTSDANALRFRTALGSRLGLPGLATAAQAQSYFLARMKELTIDYETTLENETSRVTKSAEVW